jgi:hypothetical protein
MMLKKYLQQIRAGKPIHYQKFLQLLPPGFYQRKAELFKVRATGAGKWQLTVLDPQLFAQLCDSAESPASRVTASLQGDSHRACTSHSYLLVFHSALCSDRPDLVVSRSAPDGTTQLSLGFTPKQQALLIENEENFFSYPLVLQLATRMLAQPFSLADTDVIFAAGSRISAALLQPLLAQYAHLYCAFDYDAAGLETFDTLHKRHGAKVQLLTAPDLTTWLGGFVHKPKQPQQLLKAIALAEKHHLYGLVDAFSRSQRFLEQEVLLQPLRTG